MLEEIVCPEDCASALPAVSFDKCAPDFRNSEITHIAVGRGDAAAFADWEDPVEWATRLDQAAVGDKIRLLTVRGNKPATTKTQTLLTGKRNVTTSRKHVVNVLIDEVGDTNYDFARTTQCGLQVRIWFVSNDTKDLSGGANGILATMFLEAIYDEGDGAVQKLVGTIEWDRLQDPPRAVNPIAGL